VTITLQTHVSPYFSAAETTGYQVEGKSYLLKMLIPCAGAWSAG
jgi:hypothetical protein